MTDESPEYNPKEYAMSDGCIRAMYPELTPAQRAVIAHLSGQFEEVKDLLARICEQVVPALCEDVEDDALCGPTSDLLRGVRDYIDW